jgi:hypothetical protein
MEAERRNRWIGIIIGACFIVTGPIIGYFRLDTATYSIIFFLIGGFVAGLFSSGKFKDGIKSGAWSGFLGSVIIAIYIAGIVVISLLRGPLDFVAGMGILFGLVFTALAVLFASAGGGIGAICKKALFGDGKQRQPEQPAG